MNERMNESPGASFLLVLACLVVVVHGLRLGAPILVPFALALFLAVLSLPIMFALQRRRVPTLLAIVVAVLVDVGVLFLIVLLASQSLTELQARLPVYAAQLQNLAGTWIASLQAQGIPIGDYISTEMISPSAVVDLITGTLGRIAALLSSLFLVLLIMVFILAEATQFPAKFRAIMGKSDGDLSRFAKIIKEVQEYLVIKTLVSIATGISIGTWAWIMGLDFPILLGMIGFILNYVPTIGSILASIPAFLLALILFGPGHATVVVVGYIVINLVFGNLIEPHLMGRRLGISTLVVLLSLVFWAWVWGPIGALLAVPLTMVVKIMLENTQDLRWMATLLGKTAPPPEEAGEEGPAAPADAARAGMQDAVRMGEAESLG
jgi:AI-2 transport protein TqsA